MNILFLGAAIFILSLLVLEFSFYAIRIFRHPDQAEIRKRLRRSVTEESGNQGADIYKKRVLSDMPFLNRILYSLPGSRASAADNEPGQPEIHPGVFHSSQYGSWAHGLHDLLDSDGKCSRCHFWLSSFRQACRCFMFGRKRNREWRNLKNSSRKLWA